MSPTIRIIAPGLDFEVRMGDGAAEPTQGFGGFESVSRVDDVAITEFQGADQFGQAVPVLLDGLAESRSVQAELDRLIGLAVPPNRGEPPSFVVVGPIHFPDRRWVLDDIEFGAAVRRRGDLVLVQQALTLQLLEHIAPDPLKSKPAKRDKGGKASERIYTVKGDKETLKTIAQSKLGDAKRAKEIGQLNGISDVLKKLAKGRKIRLPAK